jgi:hypothetical protein
MTSYSESVEAVENGGKCLLCGGELDLERLKILVASWSDAEVIAEGATRAEDDEELEEEELWLDSGPDFGDDGEDDEDESV